MTKKRKIAFTFVLVVMLFLTFELLLRLLHIGENIKPFELIIFTGKPYYIEDVKTIWRMKSGAEFIHKNHYICLNSHGLREREFNSYKHGHRVLCLGGSTTFGWGVSTEETFSKVLESKLRECYGKESFEVINAGIPGFTSIQGLKLLENNYELFNPDWIVFSFTYNDQTKKEQSIVQIYKYLDSTIFKIRRFLFLFRIARLTDIISKQFSTPVSVESLTKMSPSVPLENYKITLIKLIQFCLEKGIHLIFLSEVTHPENIGAEDLYKDALHAEAKEHNIAVFDTESIFMSAYPYPPPTPVPLSEDLRSELNLGSKQENQMVLLRSNESQAIFPVRQTALLSSSGDKTVFPESIRLRLLDNCHYTAEGHSLIAETLFESLARFYGDCNQTQKPSLE